MWQVTERVRLVGVCATVVASVAFYLWWEVGHRGIYQYAQTIYPVSDADEWRYTACSRLVVHGYALFSQVFSAQPPLLFLSLSAAMRLSEQSIAGARWAELGFGILALLCSVWISWLVAGPGAGAATAALLAVSPGFLLYFHTVEAEGPMMALVTLALALVVTYYRTGLIGLPALAGLALAAAVLMKLFALWALAPAVWLIAARRPETGRTVLAECEVVVATIAPVALDFALIQPRQQWDQVVRLHERAAGLNLPDTTPPLKLLAQFLGLDLGLTLVAVAGIAMLIVLRRWKEAWFLSLWLPGGLLMLLLFRPLFPHHAAILLTSLGTCAGVAVALGLEQLTARRMIVLAPVAIALVAYLVLLPRLAHDDRHLLVPGLAPKIEDLAAYVRGHSSPSDIVAVDDLAVADRAQRLVVPPLCDPSNVRLRAGYLTAADLIEGTQLYHARLVLPSFDIYRQVPGYLAWVAEHYRRERAPDGYHAFLAR